MARLASATSSLIALNLCVAVPNDLSPSLQNRTPSHRPPPGLRTTFSSQRVASRFCGPDSCSSPKTSSCLPECRRFSAFRAYSACVDWTNAGAALVSALAALLAILVSVPFGPRSYWSWRLRKEASTVEALDPFRHVAQRESLMRTVDGYANKVAATHKIPTPWFSYGIGTFIVVGAAVFAATTRIGSPQSATRLLVSVSIGLLVMCVPTVLLFVAGPFKYVKLRRHQFVRSGCPEDFYTHPSNVLWVWMFARLVARSSAKRRSKRLRKAGQMPTGHRRHRAWATRFVVRAFLLAGGAGGSRVGDSEWGIGPSMTDRGDAAARRRRKNAQFGSRTATSEIAFLYAIKRHFPYRDEVLLSAGYRACMHIAAGKDRTQLEESIARQTEVPQSAAAVFVDRALRHLKPNVDDGHYSFRPPAEPERQ